MVTINLNQVLVALLLAALIVLTVYLIILASNAIKAVKKANVLLDEGISTVNKVKTKATEVRNFVYNNKVVNLAGAGLHLVKAAAKKKKRR